MSLSIAAAEPNTPDPTYATPAISAKPGTVPSSPNGPCRTGKTTSTASDKSAGGALFLGHDDEAPRAPGNERGARAPFRDGGGKHAVLNGADDPGPGPRNADHQLVARRIERAEHIGRGKDGHFMLGRAAAEQQRDPHPLRHVRKPPICPPLRGTSPEGRGLVNCGCEACPGRTCAAIVLGAHAIGSAPRLVGGSGCSSA